LARVFHAAVERVGERKGNLVLRADQPGGELLEVGVVDLYLECRLFSPSTARAVCAACSLRASAADVLATAWRCGPLAVISKNQRQLKLLFLHGFSPEKPWQLAR
jgi:hypothetical protein